MPPEISGRQKQSDFGDTKKMIIRKQWNHNKTAILGLIIIFLFGFALSANAATVTWTGGGADYLASNPANWSGNIKPQNGEDVIFDSTSKNCIWDLSITLASLSIKSGYTGKVTLSSNATLTIAKNITWIGGGGDNLASNSANWANNKAPQNGDNVVFDGANNCTWDINISPASLKLNTGYSGAVTLNTDLTISGGLTIASGILNLNSKNLTIDGNMLIDINGSFYATSSTITVKGNWLNYGTFNPGTSTVILNGANQIIYGNTTFYNLTKTVTTADTLYFQAGSTQTIANSLTLQGASSGLLALRSTQNGSYWYIDPQGMRNISYVDIKDMYNLNVVNIVTTNSVNSGNNSNVSFGGSECVCLPLPVILTLSETKGKNLYSPLWQRGAKGDFNKFPRLLWERVRERGISLAYLRGNDRRQT